MCLKPMEVQATPPLSIDTIPLTQREKADFCVFVVDAVNEFEISEKDAHLYAQVKIQDLREENGYQDGK